MSFYRNVLAAVVAIVISAPVFATDTTSMDTQPNATSETTTTTTTTTNAEVTQVNINSATAKELMKVKGLNASKARAIVAYRKQHGDFKSVDDLKSVKGFKKMKAEHWQELENQLTVQ